ncbi:tautomerase family protein [Geomonas sp. RF6]|uniref:4-oxalocrotonate tautomerase DmpI n=1 Tax=Geomonas sp. RF6 TaxID=2897342 RepID=UPI001E44A678|nr:4-oxalocrotonate tautomerase DmpI [Geomonas sp. RF6]UFS71472.1 tautomerase family protein [Geomonas sp. RF6]
MPVITWEGGKLTTEQKRELITTLSKAASEITKVPLHFHSVLVREQADENLGVAGETVADLKARLSQAKPE